MHDKSRSFWSGFHAQMAEEPRPGDYYFEDRSAASLSPFRPSVQIAPPSDYG
jgi:hypothetical protein